MISIDYVSDRFPNTSPITNGSRTLDTSWDDLLWSAITVGRPNRQYVFRYGLASTYEAIFRWSLVRMSLEETGGARPRLQRTDAAKSLDPSEKGALNYFLGLVFCKLFASTLLDAPWMLHLDVFRPTLDVVLRGRSRPDLIGQTRGGTWLSFESKGRISLPDATVKRKAKDQARRCVSVNGVPVTYHIGGIMYFVNDIARFFWRDPPPDDAVSLTLAPGLWRYYYEPAVELIRGHQAIEGMLHPSGPVSIPIADADVTLGIHPKVLTLVMEEQWQAAKDWCDANVPVLEREGYRPDGLRVNAGASWPHPVRVIDQG